MQGDQPISWLMFFTLAAGVAIVGLAFVNFIRSRSNREIAANTLEGNGRGRGAAADGALPELVGVTAFAIEQLTEPTYLELPPVGSVLKAGDKFGTIESYKSTSDLYSPVAGTVIERNEPLVDDQPTNRKGDPKPVNDDAFGTGWMVKIKLAPGATLDHLLTAEKYDEQLASEGH